MIKNLIILLFIPVLSYSQISYEDVMSINSVEIFKKVMIENGYEFDTLINGGVTDGLLSYGYDRTEYSSGSSGSSRWMNYWTNDDRGFYLTFLMKNYVTGLDDPRLESNKNNYYTIVNDIKEKCKYFKIINDNGVDYVTYSCSESLYKGKVGFVISDGIGHIKHFLID
jgi:hypothetical protein